jgi:hypothetical protein
MRRGTGADLSDTSLDEERAEGKQNLGARRDFSDPERKNFPLARSGEIELNSARRWTGTQRRPEGPIGTGPREEVPMNGFIAWSVVAQPSRFRFLHVIQFDCRIPSRDLIGVRN